MRTPFVLLFALALLSACPDGGDAASSTTTTLSTQGTTGAPETADTTSTGQPTSTTLAPLTTTEELPGTSTGPLPDTTTTTAPDTSDASSSPLDDTGTAESSSTTVDSSSTGTTADSTTTTADSTTTTDSSTTTTTDSTTADPPEPAAVVLLLNKSGTMDDLWDHDGNPNTPTIRLWKSQHTVVAAALDDHEDALRFGAGVFPSPNAKNMYNDQACVPAAALVATTKLGNAGPILAGLPGPDAVDQLGGDAIKESYALAVAHLAAVPGPRAIVLFVDDAPNCKDGAPNNQALLEGYDDTVLPLVGDALADHGIRTYVVGFNVKDMLLPFKIDGQTDGVNPHAVFTQFAADGGTQTLRNAMNEAQLSAAVAQVIAEILAF